MIEAFLFGCGIGAIVSGIFVSHLGNEEHKQEMEKLKEAHAVDIKALKRSIQLMGEDPALRAGADPA